jgi:ABC-type amino acid transport system permease subunit
MKLTLLRYLLMVDAAILLLLGALLIFAPRQVTAAFQFKDLPAAVSYLIGLWGCVFATLGIGYVVAATHPVRHVVWVQVGIARGTLEFLLGLVYLARGVVTWQQSAFGIVAAALITGAYLALYPRGGLKSRPPA